jgi:hypothetical protein
MMRLNQERDEARSAIADRNRMAQRITSVSSLLTDWRCQRMRLSPVDFHAPERLQRTCPHEVRTSDGLLLSGSPPHDLSPPFGAPLRSPLDPHTRLAAIAARVVEGECGQASQHGPHRPARPDHEPRPNGSLESWRLTRTRERCELDCRSGTTSDRDRARDAASHATGGSGCDGRVGSFY